MADKDKEVCGRCNALVVGKDKAVQCEVCEVWFHAKCHGISDDAYKVLQKEQSVHWYCRGCEKGMVKMMEAIAKMRKKQEKLEEDVQKMAKEMGEMTNKMNGFVQEANELKDDLKKLRTTVDKNIEDRMAEENAKQENRLKETVREQVDVHLSQVEGKLKIVKNTLDEVRTQTIQARDRETRAGNIILYNVPESKKTQKEERWKDDREFCLDMFNDVLGVKIREEDVKRFLRLGKSDKSGTETVDTHERPVLIQFRDRILKNMILDSLSKMKDAEEKHKRIIFAHDMTREERIECKKMVDEAKKREMEDTSGEYIYRVRGSPGHLRIEKIRKRH